MPNRYTLPRVTRNLVLVGATMMVATANGQNSIPPSATAGKIALCRTIKEDAARLRCYEEATSNPSESPAPQEPSSTQQSSPLQSPGTGASSWRMIRTPNPAGGRDAVSIMQTAEPMKSDIDFAGLMIRCGETNLETLIVLVTPLSPRARPKITLTAAGTREDFTGTIVPPGAAVLLPNEASTLVSGPWQAASELNVQIENGADRTRGVVPLAGLSAALPTLMLQCRTR